MSKRRCSSEHQTLRGTEGLLKQVSKQVFRISRPRLCSGGKAEEDQDISGYLDRTMACGHAGWACIDVGGSNR